MLYVVCVCACACVSLCSPGGLPPLPRAGVWGGRLALHPAVCGPRASGAVEPPRPPGPAGAERGAHHTLAGPLNANTKCPPNVPLISHKPNNRPGPPKIFQDIPQMSKVFLNIFLNILCVSLITQKRLTETIIQQHIDYQVTDHTHTHTHTWFCPTEQFSAANKATQEATAHL